MRRYLIQGAMALVSVSLLPACDSDDEAATPPPAGASATGGAGGAAGGGAAAGVGGVGGTGGSGGTVVVDPLEGVVALGPGEDPAIAVDHGGRVHVVYSHQGVRYCVLTAPDSDCVIEAELGPGSNARIAIDSHDRAHVCWSAPYINSSLRPLEYGVVEEGQVVTAEIESEVISSKCRLAVDSQDRGVLYYQYSPPAVGENRLRLVTFAAGQIQPGPVEVVAVDDPTKDVRPGDVAVDSNDYAHFVFRRHPSPGPRGLFYRAYDTAAQAFLGPEIQVSPGASDFSDIAVSPADMPYVMGQMAGSHGLLYLPGTTNPLTGEAGELLADHPVVTNIDDGDYLNVELQFDRLGRQFTTFCGAGQNDPTIEVAYYIQSDAGQDYGPSTEPQRLTPGEPEVVQGGKDTNPLHAPAPNQGVLVVWSEEGQVYLRGLGGAGF